MYWSVVGCVVAVEYVAEWTVRWIPLYGLLKTTFLLWLALPQSQGATYIYRTHLAPFLTEYEPTIDSYISQYKKKLYQYLQDQFRSLWKHISSMITQHTGLNLNLVDPTASPNTEAMQGLAGSGRGDGVRPEDAASGLNQGAQMALGLWRTWGPTVMKALKPIQETTDEPPTPRFIVAPAAGPSASSSGFTDTASILARRRQLEAELAALDAMHPPGSPNFPSIPTPSNGTEVSSGSSDHPSPSMGNINLQQSQYLKDGRYEEIRREEIDDETDEDRERSEGETGPESSAAAGWWPAWGRRSSGYERVKTE